MTIKIIIDTSEATEEEIDKFHDLARITPMLSMANNAKEYGLWIQLVDKPTAIPSAPCAKSSGNFTGRSMGSFLLPS